MPILDRTLVKAAIARSVRETLDNLERAFRERPPA